MNVLANPVLARELRGRIRGNRALIILTIYLLITSGVTILVYLAIAQTVPNSFNDPEVGRNIGKGIFLTVMTASLVQVCVITPSLTAGAISGEKERQSYDLLITTLLSPLQIVVGKLVSALAFALILIVAVLPLAGLSFLFGGVSITEFLIGIAGLVVTAVAYASIGLFWSTVMQTTLGATVMAQGTVVFIVLSIPFIFFVGSLLVGAFNGDPSVVYVLTMGSLLSLHPFIALGMTEGFLSGGDGPFLVTLQLDPQPLTLPSPWIVYIFFSVLLTLLFIVLSVRLLKPVEYRVRSRKKPSAS